jgi:DNA-directed RNA polymerase subunit beta'
MLKGKQGRFRQNLLGKRVDYSGRSVIVVGPDLRLHQCGLPKKMALELFKPFIYNKLDEKGLATTIKSAKKMVERETPEVWDALDEVVREYCILLNRAPTLHRLGIQAFEPILTEGKAIQLHPLVCTAFNADFDGDQMAVHVPLSIEAQIEARVLMMSTNNILSPANGDPIIVPSQDIVLGIYYMTRERPFCKGEGKIFSNTGEVRMAYDAGEVDLHASIKVRINGKIEETTTGRVLLHEIFPEALPFSLVNRVMNKKELRSLINESYRREGIKTTVILSDRLKDIGYKYATLSGISISMKDMTVPSRKAEIIEKAEKEVKRIDDQYKSGLITDGENTTRWWTSGPVHGINRLGDDERDGRGGSERGRTGKIEQQLQSHRWLIRCQRKQGSMSSWRMRGSWQASGEIIETPITSNFREAHCLQYFISTHAEGLGHALKTANSGYLTRRLVDVAQDTVVTEEDCGTVDGISASSLIEGGEIIQRVGDRVLGRVALEDIYDPITSELLVAANDEINEERVQKIQGAGLERVRIRSVLTCQAKRGVCKKCYGRDLAHGHEVNIGEAIGIIAAQSIGEPGTQLTMRTFHIGGTASKRVEQTTIQSRNG